MAAADTQIAGRDRSENQGAIHHPVVARVNAQRYADLQLRLADRITSYAGSMRFVYLHALGFAAWMLFFECPTPDEIRTGGP